MTDKSGLVTARELDAADPLRAYRDRFHIPRHADGESVYLCGHSLGLQPKHVAPMLEEELDTWRKLAVAGHFAGPRPWVPYHEPLAPLAARLVGADVLELVHMNTLTVNLHLMMVSFYRPTQGRHRILIERGAFPSDRYAVATQVAVHGYDPDEAVLEVGPRRGENAVRTNDLLALIEREGERIALVMLPGVQYYTGEVYDMEQIAAAARKHGCAVGFDLAHAAGNIPLALHDWGADFAVWCTYKYLNSGPGAVGGCFVHARHAHAKNLPRFGGWWGQDKSSRFRMGPDFHPLPGAEGWQLSNPPIFSLTPVLASLQLFDEVGMEALRAKSLQLSGYLDTLLRHELPGDIEIITPLEPARRGAQLSLRVTGATGRGRRVYDALERAGVMCDWREPDVIRVAPVPLYNSFEDVYRFVMVLARSLHEET